MAHEWFREASQYPYLNPIAFDILQSFFEGATTKANAINTAQEITRRCIQGDFLFDHVWGVLFRLATDIPASHSDIVVLVESVFCTPDRNQARSNSDPDVETGFAWAWRDLHDSLYSDVEQVNDISDASALAWVNFNAFSAKGTPAGLVDVGWGLEHIVDALERGLARPLPANQEIALIVGAQYFIHAASYILRNPPRRGDGTFDTSWGDYSSVVSPNEGLSKARWDGWMERWESVESTDGVPGVLRDASAMAYRAMKDAEQGFLW